jgi:hypothetical protein
VKTFICPRCGQVLVLTGADKITCSVCDLVIRVKGKSRSAKESAPISEISDRYFGLGSKGIIICAIALCAVLAGAAWMFAVYRDN